MSTATAPDFSKIPFQDPYMNFVLICCCAGLSILLFLLLSICTLYCCKYRKKMKKAEAQLEELQLKLPENKVEDTKSKAPSESPVSVANESKDITEAGTNLQSVAQNTNGPLSNAPKVPKKAQEKNPKLLAIRRGLTRKRNDNDTLDDFVSEWGTVRK